MQDPPSIVSGWEFVILFASAMFFAVVLTAILGWLYLRVIDGLEKTVNALRLQNSDQQRAILALSKKEPAQQLARELEAEVRGAADAERLVAAANGRGRRGVHQPHA